MNDSEIDWDFFASTVGCFIYKDGDNSLIVAYRCNKNTPLQVDPSGGDIFIQYARGDMLSMLELADVGEIGHVCFQRRGESKVRSYPLFRLHRVVTALL